MKALVIGGSGSIGTAVTHRLLEEGYEVIVHYHSTPIRNLQQEFAGQPVQFLRIDLTQNVDLEEIFSEISNVDCLIYTSGNALYGLLQDMSDQDIEITYQLHVLQFIRLTRYFLDQLRQSEHGRIIVISSIWGETGASLETIYSTMKSAQIGFVKSLSRELALTNVTVNAIAPGFVEGNMSSEFDENELVEITQGLPQARLITPQEVAHVCAYLCHPLAKSITGTVQKVNGGWYI